MSIKTGDIVYRIITIGDAGVGKTAIIRRYLNNLFEDNTLSTVGINFSFRELTLKNGTKVQLKLIDTAGQEKYKSLTKNYYKNADGALFVFALDDKKSFDHLKDWIISFKDNKIKENIPAYIIGNKCDLPKEKIQVNQNLIEQFKSIHNYKYIESSALSDENITKIFEEMAEDIYIALQNSSKNQKGKKIAKYKQKGNNCIFCKTDV